MNKAISPLRNQDWKCSGLEEDTLFDMFLAELGGKEPLPLLQSQGFRARCSREYAEMNFSESDLRRDAALCRMASDHFEKIRYHGLAQRARLRAEAAEIVLGGACNTA